MYKAFTTSEWVLMDMHSRGVFADLSEEAALLNAGQFKAGKVSPEAVTLVTEGMDLRHAVSRVLDKHGLTNTHSRINPIVPENI